MLTRSTALRLIALLWIALGWGFTVISPRPELVTWLSDVRPIIWVAAGAWVLGTASHPRLYGWGITAMGALVGERITALLLAVVDGRSPSAWFSAATWLGVYLAVLFAAALPERVRGGRR